MYFRRVPFHEKLKDLWGALFYKALLKVPAESKENGKAVSLTGVFGEKGT
jgi:hypothetical protein